MSLYFYGTCGERKFLSMSQCDTSMAENMEYSTMWWILSFQYIYIYIYIPRFKHLYSFYPS